MPKPVVRTILVSAALGVLAACDATMPARLPGTVATPVPHDVLVRAQGRIVRVPMEDYVLGSALAEVTPLNETPATVARIYEVQAVLARTYAAAHVGRHRLEGFDVCDGTHCQLYQPDRIRTSRFAAAAREAVVRTKGEVLMYAQRPAEALFHADCGGSTAAADAVWGGPAVPYLMPTLDDVADAAHRSWRVTLTDDEILKAVAGANRGSTGTPVNTVEVRERDVSGRAETIAVRGQREVLLRGEELRRVLNLQSTRFAVTHVGRTFVFEGRGYGHGVGLCQVGAAARARRGESLQQILGTYFKGAIMR